MVKLFQESVTLFTIKFYSHYISFEQFDKHRPPSIVMYRVVVTDGLGELCWQLTSCMV